MKCKIYKIISENTPFVYIGSTKQKLEIRLNGHIRNYKHRIDYYNWFYDHSHNFENIPKKFKNEPGNTSSYKIMLYGDYSIELLEEFDYEIKSDILKREQFYINLYKDICVNTKKSWSSFTYKYYNIESGESEKQLKKDALENYYCKKCNKIGHDTSWINCCKKLNSYNYNNYKKLLEDIGRLKY
tara:strand:- start:857 stop:1411 length:555 start_codon:yes stop_codon:yes gene_type:complete